MLRATVVRGVAHIVAEALADGRRVITAEGASALRDALLCAENDRAVGACVITGNGLCDGLDLELLSRATASSATAVAVLQPINALRDALHSHAKPIVLAATAALLGGAFELAMHADAVLASSNASFALPEVRLGVIPGLGGTVLLPRIVGLQRALHIALGHRVDAQEALRTGIVSRICDSQSATEAAAIEHAAAIARLPSAALCVRAMRTGCDEPALFLNALSMLPTSRLLRRAAKKQRANQASGQLRDQ